MLFSTNEFGMLDPGSRDNTERRSLAMLCCYVECIKLEKMHSTPTAV